MREQATEVGDWIQATTLVEEELPDGHVHIHAVAGGIGHVTDVHGDEWFTVYWERTGTETDSHASEFKRLCGALAGRFPISDRRSAKQCDADDAQPAELAPARHPTE